MARPLLRAAVARSQPREKTDASEARPELVDKQQLDPELHQLEPPPLRIDTMQPLAVQEREVWRRLRND